MPYADKERQKRESEAWRLKRVEAKRLYIESVKQESGCIVCGETDPICLDLHHVSGKEYGISKLMQNGSSMETLVREVQKCVVLCCKCHRRLHAGVITLPVREV